MGSFKCRECGVLVDNPQDLSWVIYCDRCYKALKYGVEPLAISGKVYLKQKCECGGKLLMLSDGWCRCDACGCLSRCEL